MKIPQILNTLNPHSDIVLKPYILLRNCKCDREGPQNHRERQIKLFYNNNIYLKSNIQYIFGEDISLQNPYLMLCLKM